MDRQAIYNRVKDHLIKQVVCSVSSAGHCLYRGPEGSKCAIGALIDDSHYNDDLEGLEASSYQVVRAVSASLGFEISESDAYFLRCLQSVHDQHDSTEPDKWPTELADFALRWHLQP